MRNTPFLDENEYLRGLTWDEYLQQNPRSRSMQSKRYEDDGDSDLSPFGKINRPAHMIILSMPDCADCAWAIPRIVRLLDETGVVDCRFFFRREHPGLMERLKTDGKLAVPKLGLLDSEYRLVGEWGPRPKLIQEYVKHSVGRVERTKWFANVMKYYRQKGYADLDREILDLLSRQS